MYYTVKTGESISDVVLNTTGSIVNWESVLAANNFTTWTPDISVGDILFIPDTTINQPNILFYLNQYPVCNNTEINDFDEQVNELIAIFEEL